MAKQETSSFSAPDSHSRRLAARRTEVAATHDLVGLVAGDPRAAAHSTIASISLSPRALQYLDRRLRILSGASRIATQGKRHSRGDVCCRPTPTLVDGSWLPPHARNRSGVESSSTTTGVASMTQQATRRPAFSAHFAPQSLTPGSSRVSFNSRKRRR